MGLTLLEAAEKAEWYKREKMKEFVELNPELMKAMPWVTIKGCSLPEEKEEK